MSGIEFHGIVTLCGIQAEVGTSLKVIARPPLAKDAEMSKVLGVDDEEAPCGDFGFCSDTGCDIGCMKGQRNAKNDSVRF